MPGFDYRPAPTAPATLQLPVEHLNTGVYGRGAALHCQGRSHHLDLPITMLNGDVVLQYA